ncbi:hypothetical protein BLA24064_02651 [Burkholderia latens]|uniref:Uncharacterized protein n=1 Tax=Burkholderia latens TaxID=488446 RepID=A0A6P2KSK3_9BURK|nr:hypothetical protein BLA24064_02651 [Burkholderia latens]
MTVSARGGALAAGWNPAGRGRAAAAPVSAVSGLAPH